MLVVYDIWLIWKVQKRTTSQQYIKQEDWKGKAGRLWKQPPQFALWYTHPPPVWWQSPSYIILQARFGNLGRRWMSRGRSQPTMVVATSTGFVQGKMGSAGDWMVRGSSTTRSAFWPPLPPNPRPSLSLGYLFLGPILPFPLQENSLWNLMFITEYGHNQLQNAHTTLDKKMPQTIQGNAYKTTPPKQGHSGEYGNKRHLGTWKN